MCLKTDGFETTYERNGERHTTNPQGTEGNAL